MEILQQKTFFRSSVSKKEIKILQQKIAYQFKNEDLLKQALTHKSANKHNNERLEFLGDSILGNVIAIVLYQQFPDIDEGNLTRLRSQLVNGNTLCELAKSLSLGDCLTLGKGMLKTGGESQCSVLEDAFEALLGAVLLDSDFKQAQRTILHIYHQKLSTLSPQIHKDFKTQLQEYLQQEKYRLPSYEVIQTQGKDHCTTFTVRCILKKPNMQTTADANSIKKAEQQCAQQILLQLQ